MSTEFALGYVLGITLVVLLEAYKHKSREGEP